VISEAGRSEQDGRISLAAFRDGAVRELVDGAALHELESGLLRAAAERPTESVWIDMASPSPSAVAKRPGSGSSRS
jgi:hypothetical protein